MATRKRDGAPLTRLPPSRLASTARAGRSRSSRYWPLAFQNDLDPGSDDSIEHASNVMPCGFPGHAASVEPQPGELEIRGAHEMVARNQRSPSLRPTRSQESRIVTRSVARSARRTIVIVGRSSSAPLTTLTRQRNSPFPAYEIRQPRAPVFLPHSPTKYRSWAAQERAERQHIEE